MTTAAAREAVFAPPRRPAAPRDHGGWRLLRVELRGRAHGLRRMAGWSVAEALPSLVSGWLVKTASDHGFLAGRPWVGVAWLGGLVAGQAIRAGAVRRLLTLLADVVEPVRDVLVTRVVSGALQRGVLGHGRPDSAALARLTEQIRTVRGLVGALLLQVRSVTVSAVTAVIGLASLSPILAAVVLVPVVAGLLVFVPVQRGLRARRRAVLVADEHLARDVVAVLDGVRDVVACDAQAAVAQRLGTAIDAQARNQRQLAVAEAGRQLVTALAASVPLLVLLATAPFLTRGGRLGTGELLGAITYVTTGLTPAVTSLLAALGGVGIQLGVTLDRIAVTSAVPELSARPGTTRPTRYDLQTRALTHAYGPAAAPVIEDLTLTVREGEHLAVVGPSGIGKSTLADLVTGCLTSPHGAVRLGGVPLPDVAEEYLRRTVALIPQESYVFPGTVGENLRYLAPGATDAEVDHAVAAVGAERLVARLGGCHAEVGAGGRELSSADRQLLTLARVYLSPARVVVLDEATCFLDAAAEEVAESAFRARPGSLVVIAHRMSSARRADRILVMDGRRAVAGTHETLLDMSPLYRELVGRWDGTGGESG